MSFQNDLLDLKVFPIIGEPMNSIHVFDFSSSNQILLGLDMNNQREFEEYIQSEILQNKAQIGIGRYAEDRILYKRFGLFDDEESRSFHLGIDIWKKAGTPIFCPLDGRIHSFANNSSSGDYGPTIILEHQFEFHIFYTLYGHLSLGSISDLKVGQRFKKGDVLAELGGWSVNVNWPPHLHFQIIRNMKGYEGDFPGVCKPGEKENWMENCPDPNLILRLNL